MYDIAFIPSLRCNLECWFCMYNCTPHNSEELKEFKAYNFINHLDRRIINSYGFYGGEISINLDLYQKFINLTSQEIPRFTITNGSWSTDKNKTYDFIDFVIKNMLLVIISSTSEHKKYQDIKNLKYICNTFSQFKLKDNDDIKDGLNPMGRIYNRDFICNKKCKDSKIHRIGLFPDGNIYFQYCDGVYPIVGNWKSSIENIEKNINKIIRDGCI